MRAFSTLVILAAAAMPIAVSAQTAPAPAAPAAKAHFSADTPIDTLLADPGAKAVLVKLIPEIANSDQISQAAGMSPRALQQYAGQILTDAKLKEIDTELAKLPAK